MSYICISEMYWNFIFSHRNVTCYFHIEPRVCVLSFFFFLQCCYSNNFYTDSWCIHRLFQKTFADISKWTVPLSWRLTCLEDFVLPKIPNDNQKKKSSSNFADLYDNLISLMAICFWSSINSTLHRLLGK